MATLSGAGGPWSGSDLHLSNIRLAEHHFGAFLFSYWSHNVCLMNLQSLPCLIFFSMISPFKLAEGRYDSKPRRPCECEAAQKPQCLVAVGPCG